MKEPRSGISALLTLYLSLLKQEEKRLLHNSGSILLVSNASGKCFLAVFIVRKIKQDTSWSICAVTYPAILLNTKQQKKSMSSTPHRLYTSEGIPSGVKAEKTSDTFIHELAFSLLAAYLRFLLIQQHFTLFNVLSS